MKRTLIFLIKTCPTNTIKNIYVRASGNLFSNNYKI